MRCARSTQIEHFFFVPLARRRIYATNKRRLDSKKLPLPSIQQHFDEVNCMFVCLARVTELVVTYLHVWMNLFILAVVMCVCDQCCQYLDFCHAIRIEYNSAAHFAVADTMKR